MFDKLPHNSKIEICKLFYCDKFKCVYSVPKKVDFSSTYVEFKSVYGDTRIDRVVIEDWYKNNLKTIRREKLWKIKYKN